MSQKLQIKRNYNIFPTKAEALEHLNDICSNTLDDGEIVLCRYEDGENGLKTIIGVVGINHQTNTKNYTTFESLDEVHIQDNEVKISNKEGEKNFLEIDTDNNGLKVIGMDADKVSTQEITIVGTPLADLILSKKPEMKKLNASNVQEVLEILLSEELWPESINLVNGAVKGSISAPSGSNLISGVSNSSTVEVGTKCIIKKLTISKPTIQSTAYTVSGLTYGYSLNKNDILSDKIYSCNASSTKIENGNYEISLSINNGFKDAISGKSTNSVNTNVSLQEQTVYVSGGTNKITVTYSTPKVSASYDAIPVIYGCSNKGNFKENIKFDGQSATTIYSSAITDTKTFSVTGVRYGFYGCVSDSWVANSENIRNLNGKLTGGSSTSTFTISGSEVEKVIVALPSSWNKKISKVIAEKQQNSEITTAYVKEEMQTEVNGANSFMVELYDVYIFDPKTSIEVRDVITLSTNN